jgi:L-lactate dehydrogenase complex protein LldG
MSARDQILQKIKQNQATKTNLPDLSVLIENQENLATKFKEMLESIGGHAMSVNSIAEIKEILLKEYPTAQRIINHQVPEIDLGEQNWQDSDPHSLKNVDLTILKGHFGVAENGSIWLTEDLMGQRVAPFITQYLVIVLDTKNIVPTMHQAYQKIKNTAYGYGIFLAGPSKTADIEQSLVLGAHGARGLLVFLV